MDGPRPVPVPLSLAGPGPISMKLVNVLRLACRPRKAKLTTIVLHATAGASASSSISWLRKIGLSYHAIIGDGLKGDDGHVYKCVDDTKVAFHAGVSKGPNGSNVNEYSLGLAFASMDDGEDCITRAQWDAAVDRCVLWVLAYPDLEYITTHRNIAPGRKTDPKGPIEGMNRSRGRFPLVEFVECVNTELGCKGSLKKVKAW